MITYALLICLIGVILSLLFTKWEKIADAWVARLLANQLKAVG